MDAAAKTDSYIPVIDNGEPKISLTFSLEEKKGALVTALEPFKVRYTPYVLCICKLVFHPST